SVTAGSNARVSHPSLDRGFHVRHENMDRISEVKLQEKGNRNHPGDRVSLSSFLSSRFYNGISSRASGVGFLCRGGLLLFLRFAVKDLLQEFPDQRSGMGTTMDIVVVWRAFVYRGKCVPRILRGSESGKPCRGALLILWSPL